MVLSTQTLLMAVVATPAASATGGATTAVAVAGGALNWVLKDGIGQLGGVVVASRLLTGRHSKATEQHHFESNINDANEQVDGNNNSINMERMRASEAASSTSTTKTTIDAHPKLWRLVAAVTLDLAAGLELLTPLILTSTSAFAAAGGSASSTTSLLVLCWACLANVIKNVGFVAASASRAALHQSFAVSQNLADVTAKAASQGMVAGLMGTILGVTISSSLLSLSSIDPITSTTTAVSTTTTTFLVCYGLLAAVHQSCVYLAVRAVAFRDFDRQRLSLVLQHYVAISREKWQIPQYSHLVQFSVAEPYVVSGKLRHIMLTPSQVAERESLLPPSHRYDVLWNNPVDISSWLTIGGNINEAFPQGSSQLLECLDASPDAHHVLNVVANSESKVGTGVHEGKFMVHLIFLESLTSGNDVIFGMLHAHILKDLLRRSSQAGRNTMIAASYKLAQQAMNEDNFISQLMESGWDTDLSAVEECDAKRLAVFRRKTRIPI